MEIIRSSDREMNSQRILIVAPSVIVCLTVVADCLSRDRWRQRLRFASSNINYEVRVTLITNETMLFSYRFFFQFRTKQVVVYDRNQRQWCMKK